MKDNKLIRYKLMNNEQQDYYDLMKVLEERAILDCSMAGLSNIIGAFTLTYGIVQPSLLPLAPFGGLCIFAGIPFSKKVAKKIKHSIGCWSIRHNPKKYPFEYVDSIVIDDSEGLEMLLEKTAKKEDLEWGTVHKAHEENRKAIIDKVIAPAEAIKEELITKATKNSLVLDEKKAKQLGYRGFHHYHPSGGAYSFEVSIFDRTILLDFINLLSFNRASGPEIVGYNYQHTYIPADKSKTRLVKATPEEIMAYLS